MSDHSSSRESMENKPGQSQGMVGFNPPARRATYYEPLFPLEPAPFPLLQDPELAAQMAMQCLDCDSPAPCVEACPLETNIPEALHLIQDGQILEAGKIFSNANPLSEICGRLCPHNLLCQAACDQIHGGDGVQIGLLEEYAAYEMRRQSHSTAPPVHSRDQAIAVVGSGPAGLTCADQLIHQGFRVHVFESMPEPGGMLRYGIPEYKIPPGWVDEYIHALSTAGVIFNTGSQIGKDQTVQDLMNSGFSCVFLAAGCDVDIIPDIPGTELPGVFQASQFIALARRKQVELPPDMDSLPAIGHRIVVLGGNSKAMDCLRAALHIGTEEVTSVFHQTEAEMSGGEELRKAARDAGAHFRYLTCPIRFLADAHGHAAALECLQCELSPSGTDEHRGSVPIPGSNFLLRADTIVLALGVLPDPLIGSTTPGLSTHAEGLIIAEGDGSTSLPGVYAGGDAVRGPHYVPTAVRDGIRAAAAITRYLASAS